MPKRKKPQGYTGEQLAFDLGKVQSAQSFERLLDNLAEAEANHDAEGALSTLLDPKKAVVMSNRFVVGIESGSRFAHKISRIAIGDIPMNADELPMTVISADDIESMGFSRTRLTGHLNEVMDEILSYRIKIASIDRIQKDARLTGINMFSQASIIPGKGAIIVGLNPALKEHFLHLRQDFTQYSLPVVTKMNSYAASKLHELLLCRSRQYCHNLFRFHIEDLAVILNYKSKGPYKPSTFVNNVIKRAVASINENTECRVTYRAVKVGREFKDIRFYVEPLGRTLEEKQEYLRWEEDCLKDPTKKKLVMATRLDIETKLQTGEGELCPEDIPSDANKN